MKNDDFIRFINSSGETVGCNVVKICWYKTIENLLTYEGTKYILSYTDDFDEVVKYINSINSFK